MSTATLYIEKKKTLVPQLRFQEFKDEWEMKTLSELAKKITDGTHDTPKPVKDGIPFLTAIHIKDGFVDYSNCYYLDQDVHNSIYKRCNPEKDDLLIVNIGAGTATCAINTVDYEFSLKNVALVKPNKEKLDGNFLGQVQRKKTSKIFNQLTSGGAQPFLSLKEIGRLKISLPNLPEQQKIASFLSAVDEKTQQLSRKKDLLEQYKKGVMQKLFSGKLRFKDENGKDYPDWEEKKLGDFCTFFSGGTPTSTNQDYYSGTIPFIGSGNIYDSEVFNFISEEALNSSSAKIVEKGDLLYALYGANSGEVAISKINGAINQAILCIRNEEVIEYLYYILLLNKDNIVAKFLQGGQGNLSAQIIKRLKYKFPSIQEQQKIASFLSSIDVKIESTNQQINQTQNFKKGLLQQMFV